MMLVTYSRKLLIFVVFVLISAAPLTIQAQSITRLPADFIFQTYGYNNSFLVKVDAHTQKQSLFYYNNRVGEISLSLDDSDAKKIRVSCVPYTVL